MNKNHIALCLLALCIIFMLSGGCAHKKNQVDPLKSMDRNGNSAAVLDSASNKVLPGDDMGEEPENAVPEEVDVDTEVGTVTVKEDAGNDREYGVDFDTDAQRVLFGNSQLNDPKPPAGAAGSNILLNFDDAELSEVIREFADMLGINYMLDPAVNGKVTIHSAVPMDEKKLFPVFLQILDANGLTAIRVGELYQIGKSKDASKLPLLSRIGRSTDGAGAGQKIIMQIVPLKYISSQQISELIKPFVSTEGMIFNYGEANTLIIVDKEINILKALKLVEVFDIDVFDKTNHAIYRLENVDAKETVKVVQELVSAYGSDFQKETKIISVERLNALIVFSRKRKIFDSIESFLETLDVPTYNVEPQLYVYSVRNGRADELSTLLGSVFSKNSGEAENAAKTDVNTISEAQPEIGNPFSAPGVKKNNGGGSSASGSAESGSLKGEVKITADETRNALIIEAIPSDYFVIEKILNKIDVLPRQVLIEVTIAEVTLTKDTQFGLQWMYKAGKGMPGTSVINADIGTDSDFAGLTYLIGESQRWTNSLKALASDGKVNILSAPTILASDNKEATINVSTEVPVATAQYETTGETNPILTTNIQYRNTGVILTVTPHINQTGLVSMDINQEVSNQLDDPVAVGSSSLPAFFKRSVKTSLTVNDDQTIVIGGLISGNRSKGDRGIPILKDIPLLKFLFRTQNDNKTRTELILLITPKVIASLEDVDLVTDEFKSKVKGIQYSIE